MTRTLVQRLAMTEWTAFTPVFDIVTMSYSKSYYRRVGDTMEIISRSGIGTNAGTATDITLTIPEGLHIDNSKVGNVTYSQYLGTVAYYHSGGPETGSVGSNLTTNQLKFYTNTYSSIQGNNPYTWVSGDIFSFNAKIPIAEWAI